MKSLFENISVVQYNGLDYSTQEINRNFKIKVSGMSEGQMSGKYDESCVIDGELVYEEYVSEDFVLDVIISNNKKLSK